MCEPRPADARTRADSPSNVLADLAEVGVEWPQLVATNHLRLAPLEDSADARLAAGRHFEVVAMLEPVALCGPPRERMCAQLMLALYRCGRQADSLDVYRRARAVLVKELGLDPHRQMQELERAILRHDPALTQENWMIAPEPRQELAVPRPRSPVRTASGNPRHDPVASELKYVSALVVTMPLNADAIDGPELVCAAQHELAVAVHTEVEAMGGVLDGSTWPMHVALFGVPRNAEDDPQRAVVAALGIRDSLALLRSRDGWWHAPKIAICTGEVLVRHTVSGYDVTGTLVDECMRMHERMEPGGLRVCRTTQYSCAQDFAYRKPGSPGDGFEVVGVNRGPARQVTAPLVGRDHELRALHEELAEAERTGRARLAVVSGQSGIGKSRLVREFGETVTNQDPSTRFLIGQRVSPRPRGALEVLGDIVRAYVGIDDDLPHARVKLGTAVRDLIGRGHAADWIVSRLRALVGSDSRTDHQLMATETQVAFRRLLEEIAARQTLVVVFEDADLLDEPLLNFINGLVTHAVPVPMLAIVTTKPRSRPVQWQGRTIELDALSPYDTGRLIENLATHMGLCDTNDSLTGQPLERFRNALLDRIGGNPQFAVEYVRMLRDGHPDHDPHDPTGWLDTDMVIALPRKVHSIVAARLDELPPVDKEVLRDAAILVEPVDVETVAAVSMRDRDEAHRVLENLVRTGLLAHVRNTAQYVFRHAVVRTVAASQLLRREQSDRHRRAAQWLARRHDHDEERVVYHQRLASSTRPKGAAVAHERSVVVVELFEEGGSSEPHLLRSVH